MKLHYENILIKIIILFFLVLIIGLPINSPIQFLILLFLLPVIIFSQIVEKKRIYISFFILLIFFCYKYFMPSLVIQEGHNVILLNKFTSSYYEKNLPRNVYNFFKNEFKIHFIDSDCPESFDYCWKSYNSKVNTYSIKVINTPNIAIYATSADWSLNKIKYSRITKNINISSLTSAKIGIVNNLDFNFYNNGNSVNDIHRDNMPFFVMYEIPKLLINSSLCWKGNVFWEFNSGLKNSDLLNDNFLHQNNTIYKCSKIESIDLGKKIYAASFGPKNELILKLEKSNYLKIVENFEKILIFFTIFLILIFNLRFNYKIYLFSLVYLSSYSLLLFYINKDLFYGFDIFPGGMDGLVYMDYSHIIHQHLLNLNFYEVFKGVEPIFYFPSSLRYFWSLNKFIFGESFYGYLLIPFFYSGIIFYIFKYIVGIRWALFITIVNFYTNAFDGYALPNIKLLNHINVGHAEPLAIFFILLSLLILLMFIYNKINCSLKFYNFLFGFFLFLGVTLRPDYLPSAFVLVCALVFYNYYFHKIFFSSFIAIIGFLFIFLIPFHNYYYGNAYVLFTHNHPIIYIPGVSDNTGVPLRIYLNVFIDLIQFNYNENINNIINQVMRWIKPEQYHYIISIMIIFFLLIKKNEYSIKIICLLALSQHLVLLVFEPEHRYAYLAWILTIILDIYFIKNYIINQIVLPLISKYFSKKLNKINIV